MKKAILLGLIFFAGCAPRELTKEQQDYLTLARHTPLKFDLPHSQADAAWGRVQAFVARYSSMKLQIATNFALNTYNPSDCMSWGYDCSRSPIGDSDEFSIGCTYSNNEGFGCFNDNKADANDNAHICAYYAIKAIEPPDGLVAR